MPIATLDDVATRIAQGKMVVQMGIGATTGTITSANSTSGYLSMYLTGNATGSTWPTTNASFQMPSVTGDCFNLLNIQGPPTSGRGSGFARIYKVGTLNLTATGDQFTHDAATFPLLRTVYGQSNTAISLIPFLLVTTATTVTAPAFQIQTNAGGAGYVNQAGSNIIGTKTFTFPSASIAVGSCFFLPLNNGDYACRDITQIKVTTASSTGAADIYLLEELAYCQSIVAGTSIFDNFMDAGLFLSNQTPAVATSGTATSALVCTGYGSTNAWTPTVINVGVMS